MSASSPANGTGSAGRAPAFGAPIGFDLRDFKLKNRRTFEYEGPCPFCRSHKHFLVWDRPNTGRYWCRNCGQRGSLRALTGESVVSRPSAQSILPRRRANGPEPRPAHIPFYRQLYEQVALWAHANLLVPYNPEPLEYLHKRGLHDATARRHLLGYGLNDPQSLAAHLRDVCPELLPYAEEAGVLVRDRDGVLRTHWNLCGCLVFPYSAEGEIVDLRTRTFPGKGYRSLTGGYTERGALRMFGWDWLDGIDTVIITEGEFKALAALQAYQNGQLSAPALNHPGLSYLHADWPQLLVERGVQNVVLAYDSQPRPIKEGVVQLSPEERYTLVHGQTFAAAGLQVRVLRLPLRDGADKADLDAYALQHGLPALQKLLDAAPLLADYHASIPAPLLKAARLPLHSLQYPQHRPRPRRLREPPPALPAPVRSTSADPAPTPDLATVRASIPQRVAEHATDGEGFLVLAHPPGSGKGYGTTQGLRTYLQEAPDPSFLVWTALRKNQLHDQQGLELIPLDGRINRTCHKVDEARVLSEKGYNVRQALCQRRCPFVDRCVYLQQFGQEGDFFATLGLLRAPGWWHDAGVLVLDEFSINHLLRPVQLGLHDLAALTRATDNPNAHAILRWLGPLVGSTTDRALVGTVLLNALDDAAAADGLDFRATLLAAVAALPPDEEQALLPNLPHSATLRDYQQLPPAHLPTLLRLLAHEDRLRLAGRPTTSRFEAVEGCLHLYLRYDHLIAQLARPEQPKIVLDATVSPQLLHALFPDTPIEIIQPHLALPCPVTQIVRSDWAKSTLNDARRREQWFEGVSSHIRHDRPTLVVCTKRWAPDLQQALQERGHTQVEVAYYGNLRGSNAYVGYDVILAQVYNPNLQGIVRQGRALFADDPDPLIERMTVEERTLTSVDGETWTVSVPTFADARLAALLEQQREAELLQAALRGRPFDHPDVQITLMFALPLENLPPTVIVEDAQAGSSSVRRAVTLQTLIDAGTQLLQEGRGVLDRDALMLATGASSTTVREHWSDLARALRLKPLIHRRIRPMPNGGARFYAQPVLVRRGRAVPSAAAKGAVIGTCDDETRHPTYSASQCPAMMNQAHNKDHITSLTHHCAASQCDPVQPKSGGTRDDCASGTDPPP